MAVSADFLWHGWNFPIAIADGGTVVRSYAGAGIEQSIWLIFGSGGAERVMRPDLGCGIHDLVFSLNNATTAARVAEEVQDSLLLFEPRIDVLNVEVTTPDDSPETMMIAVSYRVRTTNNVFNLVYPFYLGQGAT